jgi:hypothetical protein
MPDRASPRSSVQDEAEQLMREVARDSMEAARIGWRIASRVGQASLRWAERATDQVLDEVEKSRSSSRGARK